MLRNPSLTKQLAVALRVTVVLPVLLADLSLSKATSARDTSEGAKPQQSEHPYIDPKDIKTETCLVCHPEMQQGKFVHTAAISGCDSCHQIVSEKQKQRTTITLLATDGELCGMCHEAPKEPIVHGPVKAGQCLQCHDPHASAFKAQTRADGNALCLACHAPRRATGDTVMLFRSIRISNKDFEAIPKIELDPLRRIGHPRPLHPVAEIPNPLNPKEKISCLSCHQPHSSTQQGLLNASAKEKDLCSTCHQALEEQKKSGSVTKKAAPTSK